MGYRADRHQTRAPINTLFAAQAIARDLISDGREKDVQEILEFI